MSEPIIPITPAQREALAEEAQRQARIGNPRVAEIVTIEGNKARARADAWARSAKGTPYGVTEPVKEEPPR